MLWISGFDSWDELTEAEPSCLEDIRHYEPKIRDLKEVMEPRGKASGNCYPNTMERWRTFCKDDNAWKSKLVFFQFISIGGFRWVPKCVAQLLFTSAFLRRLFFKGQFSAYK